MSQTPGCFGSVLYHDATARRCSVCPFVETCKTTATQNKAEIDTWFGNLVAANKSSRKARKMVVAGPQAVASPTSAASTTASTPAVAVVNADGASSSDLNKKPREFVERWTAKGIDFKAHKSGKNGFELCGNKFAAVAMQFFMDNAGGVTKLQLTDELIAKCGSRGQGWGMGTAASHAGIVIEAFEYLGIIHQVSGKIYLR